MFSAYIYIYIFIFVFTYIQSDTWCYEIKDSKAASDAASADFKENQRRKKDIIMQMMLETQDVVIHYAFSNYRIRYLSNRLRLLVDYWSWLLMQVITYLKAILEACAGDKKVELSKVLGEWDIKNHSSTIETFYVMRSKEPAWYTHKCMSLLSFLWLVLVLVIVHMFNTAGFLLVVVVVVVVNVVVVWLFYIMLYACICVYVYVCICIYIYIYVYAYTNTHVYLHTYIYIYAYVPRWPLLLWCLLLCWLLWLCLCLWLRAVHNFNLRVFNLRVSNPNKVIAYFVDAMSDFNVPGSRLNKKEMKCRKPTAPSYYLRMVLPREEACEARGGRWATRHRGPRASSSNT